MSADVFRELALRLPEVVEGSHHGHPDFRVRGRVFATLGPDDRWGMVKLTPAHQSGFTREHPDIFEPIPGGWGRQGCTRVELSRVADPAVHRAIRTAWLLAAPKTLAGDPPPSPPPGAP